VRKVAGVSGRGWILFAVMSVVWGVPYLMTKAAVKGVVDAPSRASARETIVRIGSDKYDSAVP
jgi:hypothetical protein